MMILETVFFIAALKFAHRFRAKRHKNNQHSHDELKVYRDARLLQEYKQIMQSSDCDKFTRLDTWSVKVLQNQTSQKKLHHQ